MLESTRPRREGIGLGPGGSGDIFSGADAPGLVTVNHGPYCEQIPVGGMSVAEVRRRFRSRFDIDPHSQAYIDGAAVNDSTIVRTGQVLIFARKAGEKGFEDRGSRIEDRGSKPPPNHAPSTPDQ
jgi:hypothetical protein